MITTSDALAERVARARRSAGELLSATECAAGSDETACAALLANLVDIAECWAADADENRMQQVAELVQFCESSLDALRNSVAGAVPGSNAASRICSDAQLRWGDYLGLLDSGDSSATNPWNQLLDSPAPAAAAVVEADRAEGNGPENVAKILSALSAAGKHGERPASGSRNGSPLPRRGATPLQAQPPVPPDPTRLEIDDELRSAYVEDAELSIAQIESTLLYLEREPKNAESLQQLCRALHTMKGASASVGLAGLASYLHDLEDFVQLSCGENRPLDIQPMLRAVDALRAQVQALASHRLGTPAGNREPANAPERNATRTDNKQPAISVVAHPVSTRASEESIRVEAGRLDRLMDLLGELVISRNRRDNQVGRMKQLHAELMRTATRLRMLAENMNVLVAIDSSHGLNDRQHGELGTTSSSSLGTELLNDILEIARSLREMYEPVLEENLATSRLMGQFRHELMELRRLPLSGLFLRLQRAARDAANSESKQVQFELRGEHAGLEPSLQERLYEPLLHLVRNAVSHGIESETDRMAAGKPPIGTVAIETRGDPTSFVIEVRDDGKGLDYDAIQRRGLELGLLERDRPASQWQLAQLMFHPGFSTRHQITEVSGRGVGLDVVASVVDRLRGHIEVESLPGQGTSVRLRIPLRSSIEHTMIVRVDGHLFALPMQFVHSARSTAGNHEPAASARGQWLPGTAPTVLDARTELPCVRARDLLSLGSSPRPPEEQSLIVGHCNEAPSRGGKPVPGGRVALLVDSIVGPEEVVVRSLPPLFKRNRLLAGVTLSGAREIMLLLDGRELIDRALTKLEPARTAAPAHLPAEPRKAATPKKVLVVDDSVSVRRTLNRMLERRGYAVTEAADGLEALDLLRTFSFSLVVTDLEMPRLGGMELLAEIRRVRKTRPIAVAVVSSVTSLEIQHRALELGANAYIIKPVTDATVNQLLDTLRPDGTGERQET